jgi:hypothetical protein
MIYLNSQYYLIDGVSLLPDHADPLLWYRLPMMPRLNTSKDASGADMPAIQLIEYVGAAGAGGFIDFDVNIGLEPDVEQSVKQKLQQQAHLSDLPKLSQVPFVDGSVRLLILGTDTGAPATPQSGGSGATTPATAPASGSPRFVIKAEGAAKPSLIGDNQATFSVQLDQYGATILEQALKEDAVILPMAVIYALDFVALRPAFNVHLHIDWDRVQTYMDQTFHAGILFFSSDIEKEIDKLIENRVITIDVDTFVTDSDGGKSVSEERDRAVSEVYDMIKDTFFQSSLPPPTPGKPDDWDRAVGTYKSISQFALTGGASNMAAFSRKEVDLSHTDKKKLDVNISERTSVQRTIYPQGHLSSVLSAVKKTGVSLDRFILKVDLDNPWFQRRHVNVVSHADFDSDAIDSIDVDLTYQGEVKSVSLTKASPKAAVEWNSKLEGGQMVRPVTWTMTVNFTGVDTSQRPTQLISQPATEIGDSLGVNPRGALYSIATVPIRADSLPWDRYPSVEFAGRYDDDDGKVHLQASAVLTSQSTELNWPLFMSNPSKRSFSYRLSYALASGGVSTTPWLTTDGGKIDVVDPFPAKSTLMVIPALDWTTVNQALVHVSYPDADNPVVQKNYIFSSANSAAQTFVADRQDPTQTSITYEARIIARNGGVWTVPRSVTTDSFLTIQSGMKGHQLVTVQTEKVDFASTRVTEVDVQLRYADAKNNLTAAASYKLAAQTDVQRFAFEYLDPSVNPEFRADIQLDNGQTKSLDWSPVSGGAVVISLQNLF